MNIPEKIIEDVKDHVLFLLMEKLSPNLKFHNLRHTFDVVDASYEIGRQEQLTEDQLTIVQVAAWFHDCGYVTRYIGHEETSKEMAKEFLTAKSCDVQFISDVLKCIDATRYPQKPQTLEEQVISDADFYHFTKPGYHNYEEALRYEFEFYLKKEYTDETWAKGNCDMLTQHAYFTQYGREVLQKFKEINIERMRNKCS